MKGTEVFVKVRSTKAEGGGGEVGSQKKTGVFVGNFEKIL